MQAQSPRSTEKGIPEDAMSNLALVQHVEVCQVDGGEGQDVDILEVLHEEGLRKGCSIQDTAGSLVEPRQRSRRRRGWKLIFGSH